MKKLIITCVALLATLVSTRAQGIQDEAQISAVIAQLFKGMEQGDSAMVHGCFANPITMATARRDKEGNQQLVRESSMEGFLRAVGTPHPDTWFEEIWGLEVKVDGDFAQAWCDYAFYAGNRFSHCGVDAFHLFRTKEGWRIFHLADTRRTTGCDVPPEIQQKHKP